MLFVATFLIEGAVRPHYSPRTMFVSALSLGPRGWIQITNFVLFGGLLLLFARGAVAPAFPDGKASRAGPQLLSLIALGLLFSGPCVMDPTGTALGNMTWHGIAHALLGALVFSLTPISCFVFWRRFRDDALWSALRTWTLAAGVLDVAAVALLRIATPRPPSPDNALTASAGAIQRAALITWLVWVVTLALAIRRRQGAEPSGRA